MSPTNRKKKFFFVPVIFVTSVVSPKILVEKMYFFGQRPFYEECLKPIPANKYIPKKIFFLKT